HENGIRIKDEEMGMLRSKIEHDPSNLSLARERADDPDSIYLGLFYQNKNNPRYDEYGAENIGWSTERKMDALNKMLDRYAI
ncbi:MAG: hypothetical protein OEW75_15870, partial [Cyclobacteriaceae bacterium]|nr:hypothetical protein [Cyclobacteriaceae bacterium]